MIGFGQTNLETQNWIKQKIENYAFQGSGVKYEYTVKYQDGDIWIAEKLDMNGYGHAWARVIPIKEIGFLKFEEKKYNVWLTISTKNKSNKITRIDLISKEEEMVNKVNIMLSKSILNEDYPSRIKKAFNKLIEFNGGVIVKEVF